MSIVGARESGSGVAHYGGHLLDRAALVGVAGDVGERLHIVDVNRALEVVVISRLGQSTVLALRGMLAKLAIRR